MAALEESYFALGEEVMQAGLDLDKEEKFRDLFDDLLAKREDVRRAAQRSTRAYVPRSRKARRSHRELPPMTEDEINLLHDVRRVIKAWSGQWIPLSQLLEDAKIRRARWKLPAGLALWEWLCLRFGDQLTTVNESSDMLLQLTDDGSPDHSLSLEERRQELSMAVFETLAVLQRDFPGGGGLSLDDLQRIPALAVRAGSFDAGLEQDEDRGGVQPARAAHGAAANRPPGAAAQGGRGEAGSGDFPPRSPRSAVACASAGCGQDSARRPAPLER
ncbi:unnamed protein product [Effrenium voratum]|uniref:Uncharacterized protein n=1 Tax=Effrenium voratum TaxID=2562239 RepID=A0AA36MXL2_9DINO|nr:unnamed protein product [Effrenium voratum]CAJ1448382.1 unnamed protein product [Effrenium voratum]